MYKYLIILTVAFVACAVLGGKPDAPPPAGPVDTEARKMATDLAKTVDTLRKIIAQRKADTVKIQTVAIDGEARKLINDLKGTIANSFVSKQNLNALLPGIAFRESFAIKDSANIWVIDLNDKIKAKLK